MADITKVHTKYLCIDLSYYIFYRFHSTWTWFSFKNKEDAKNVLNPYENDEFREKFREMFVSKMKELPYSLGILPKPKKQRKTKTQVEIPKETIELKVYISKDCIREDIWRTKLFPDYKGNRVYNNEDPKNPWNFFKMVYREELYKEAFPDCVFLEHPHLEADDCIALTVKQLQETHENPDITIITSDMDYLQLMKTPNIQIYTLQEKPLKTEKSSTGNAELDLELKICMGDVSDNISPIKKRFGRKKYIELLKSRESFEAFLDTHSIRENYEFNKTLVSFDKIPLELQKEFYSKYFD